MKIFIATCSAFFTLLIPLSAEEQKIDLVSAIYKGNPLLVQKAIEAGEPVNKVTSNGDTPLLIAVESRQLDIIKILLRYDADINKPNYVGSTPLHVSSLKGYIHITHYLLRSGANVNSRDIIGYTPLITAALYGHKTILCLLIGAGANINDNNNKHGITALIAASTRGRTDIVQYLLQSGADIRIKNKEGHNALAVAIENKHIEVIKYIIETHRKMVKSAKIMSQNGLILRQNPSDSSHKIMVIPYNSEIKLLDEQEALSSSSKTSWLKVLFRNNLGWVNRNSLPMLKVDEG